ncbi:MAG: hypothetical protein CMD77_07925 [Gammaproteobacteria bacterium]|nr:hypothetical protein [Gammaproteobacteria bacterium]
MAQYLINWLSKNAKRVFSRKFWQEAFFTCAIGGGVFLAIWFLREKQLFMGMELYHHDKLHLAQSLDFSKPYLAQDFPWLDFKQKGDSWSSNRIDTKSNIVVVEGTEKDVRQFGWPLEDQTLASILERIASFEPKAILLDIYRDIPVPRSGTQIHKLEKVLTNHTEIVVIRQIDLTDPEMTIEAPKVLRGDPTRIAENSFASDSDTTIRRGMLYMNDNEGGFHMSVAYQMVSRFLPDDWIGAAPSPLLTAYIPLGDLGITNGQAIRFAGFQEGASDDWSIDWTESAKATIVSSNTPIAEIRDRRDMEDPHGDLRRVSMQVDEEVMTLQMQVDANILPPSNVLPKDLSNRYYFHWLLDLDSDVDTGWNSLEYEGAATGVRDPIGVDVIIQVGWRDGAPDGVKAYRPGEEDKPIFEDFGYTGSNPDYPFRFQIGKAVYNRLETGDGPYVGEELSGYTYPFDYKGSRGEDFNSFTIAQVMDKDKDGARCCNASSCKCPRAAEKEDFKGKLVFFGAVAKSLKDVYSLPHEDNEYLIYAHAMASDQLLRAYYNGDPLTQYWSSKGETTWIILWSFMGVLLGLFVKNNPGTRLLIFGPVLFAILFTAVLLAFFKYNYWLPFFPPALAMFGSAVLMVFYLFLTEGKQKKAISGMFSTMVSPEVLKFLQEDPDNFRLAGDRKPATIFFSDVAGFTTIAEKLSAEELAKVLNEYLTPLSDIIIRYGGYIDKYMGDAIMADFGVPVWNDEDPDSHAWKSCWAAIEQQEMLVPLSADFKEKYDVEIAVRMGVNTGFVSAGNMGSTQKMQYTVMGDAVNQAARFEPACKIFGVLIMIGESTYQMAKDKIEARKLGLLVAKGKYKSVEVYELLAKKGDLDETKSKLVQKFEAAWAIYAQGKFDEAKVAFGECLKIVPDDGPSLAYIEQCTRFTSDPPPENWAGEWIQLAK